MNEQIWYLYQNGQQLGPFSKEQLSQLHSTKMIAQDCYLFKVGWKEWRPIEDGLEELGLGKVTTSAGELQRRRASAPRATVSGRVVIHNDQQLTIGNGVNISATGMFVETSESMFKVGERLKVTVRCDGLRKPFNAIAEVIRFANTPPYPAGYGFKFEGLSEAIKLEIHRLVESQQVTDDAELVNFKK